MALMLVSLRLKMKRGTLRKHNPKSQVVFTGNDKPRGHKSTHPGLSMGVTICVKLLDFGKGKRRTQLYSQQTNAHSIGNCFSVCPQCSAHSPLISRRFPLTFWEKTCQSMPNQGFHAFPLKSWHEQNSAQSPNQMEDLGVPSLWARTTFLKTKRSKANNKGVCGHKRSKGSLVAGAPVAIGPVTRLREKNRT